MMQAVSKNLNALLEDTEGVSIVEFALIAPALLVMLMGLMDVSYNMYATAILEGTIQEAGRDSTIEAAATGSIDSMVEGDVKDLVSNATLTFERKAYAQFSDVMRAEDFTDVNGDGICNDNEPYEDANGNNAYDSDRGIDGIGGARDAVLYTATMTYPRAFPLAPLIGIDPNFTVSATTVLRNQPFSNLETPPATGNCV